MLKRIVSVLALMALVALPAAADAKKENERIENAGDVMKEILDVPDNIPQDLLDKAECVIILPSVLKAAFGVGASYGRGIMTCRGGANWNGPWTAPAMYRLEGGSFGFQIGGQATDFVLLIMNAKGATSLMGSKVKLGADAAAAAGPKGRDLAAATDVTMRAEILSYSRSRGAFAGVSLEGSTLRPDSGANKDLYGRELTARQILRGNAVKAPASAGKLLNLLNTKCGKHKAD